MKKIAHYIPYFPIVGLFYIYPVDMRCMRKDIHFYMVCTIQLLSILVALATIVYYAYGINAQDVKFPAYLHRG